MPQDTSVFNEGKLGEGGKVTRRKTGFSVIPNTKFGEQGGGGFFGEKKIQL